MKVFIVGPMAGRPALNEVRFRAAFERWVAAGHTVRTPHDVVQDLYAQDFGRPFDPSRENVSRETLRRLVLWDLKEVSDAEAVVALDGWESSRFARIEVMLAASLGVRMFSEHGRGMVRVPRLTFVDPDAVVIDDSVVTFLRSFVDDDKPLLAG